VIATVGPLLVAIFATFTVQVMVLLIAPLKAVAIGVPVSTATALVAAWGVLGILADLPGSALSDSLGRRRVIAVGGLTMGVAALIFAVSTELMGLVTGMVVFGVGQALSFGPALAFLTEVAPENAQPRIQGLNGAVQGVSSVTAALLAGVLIPHGFDVALGAVLGLSIVVSVAVLSVGRSHEMPMPVRRRPGVLGSYARALHMIARRPPVTFAALISVVYAIGFLVVTASVVPIVLTEFDGEDPTLVGIVIAVRNLVAATLSLTFPAAVNRFGLVRSIVATSWVAVIGTGALALMVVASHLGWVALLIQAVGMAYGAAATNLLVRQSTSEQERAVGMSATTLTSRITVLVVPLLIGPFMSQSTVSLVFLVAAGLGVPAVLLMSVVGRDVRDPFTVRAKEGSAP
jgi:DHA1 family bicyclomycin/chloramphenicol resistance-like MFS transporter